MVEKVAASLILRIEEMHEQQCDHRRDAAAGLAEWRPCTCAYETSKAWLVKEGDRILMPDDRTWCTIESIQRESDTGRLLMLFVEPGFARHDPDEMVRVRRGA